MKIKLVEVTAANEGWKGTWYKQGQRHFVRQYPDYPKVYATRWESLGRVCGGIDEKDCKVLTGPVVWVRCALKTVAEALRLTESARVRAKIDSFVKSYPADKSVPFAPAFTIDFRANRREMEALIAKAMANGVSHHPV